MASHRSFGPELANADSVLGPLREAGVALYPAIFQGLRLGVVILCLEDPGDARTFRIVDLNPAAAEIIRPGREDLRGHTLADFPSILATPFAERCQEAFRTREVRDWEEIFRGDKYIGERIFSVQIVPLPGKHLGVALDEVTNRKKAERALQASEDHIRSLLEGVQQYAIFRLDPLGNVTSWNRGAERLKGYKAEDIVGKHFSVFYPKEDAAGGKPARILAGAVRLGQTEDEGWRLRKDGSRFWANVVVTALRDSEGRLQGFVKITRDVSERRQKEEALTKAKVLLERRIERRAAALARVNQELRTEIAVRKIVEEQHQTSLGQLRALTARLQSVREDERASIAREIHDELGQACTAIKMDLVLVRQKLAPRQASLGTKVHSAIQLVDEMIVTLRRIASELRPRILDDLGLAAALEWQGHEFEERTGIRCCVTLPTEPIILDPERSTAIFRVFQESLTNVARHAHATRVETHLKTEIGGITLQVRDNGKGFDPDEVRNRTSLGLIGMQERAILLKGELTVESYREAGTIITLRIPLPTRPNPHRQDASSDS